MQRRTRCVFSFVIALATALAVAACGGGGGAGGAEDAAPPVDAGPDAAADAALPDTAPDDVAAATPCERDEECTDVFADLAPCQIAICDTVRGACAVGRQKDKTPCDDGDPCTTGSACSEGACGGGATYSCADEDPCTAEACDGEGGCTFPPSPTETPCDDGNACTAGDACGESGACAGTDDGSCACSADTDCVAFDDGNTCNGVLECQDARCRVRPGSVVVCDTADDTLCARTRCVPESGQCARTPVADGASCDDGDPCTLEDACVGGLCGGHPGECPCQEDGDCEAFDDGDLCNGTLACQDGACVVDPATRVQCEDDDVHDCVIPRCEPSTGTCQVRDAVVGASCDDGDACTTGATCAAGGVCAAGGDVECDDGDPCTDDGCVAPTGCTHTANTAPCDDGNACTDGDGCRDGVCVAGASVVCDDANECTDDSCNAETGCVNRPVDGRPCDDGDPCSGSAASPDQCVAGVCVGGEPCTCQSDEDCVPLEDADRCNGNLRCVAEQCVVDPASVVVCPTGQDDDCRRSACQPATGLCVLQDVADGLLCDDGDACTTADSCRAGVCTAGAPLPCDDGDECTEDGCAGGACANTPIPRCGGGCETADDCVDDDPCTLDACDAGGDCTHTGLPNGSLCEDGDPCSGGDQCQAGACQSGGVQLCGGTCNPAGTLSCGAVVASSTWEFEATLFMSDYPCLTGTYDGPEMAYVFVAQASQRVTATLADDSGLSLVVLRSQGAGCDPLRCVAGDEGGGPLSWTVEAGETWFVVIDGANGASNAFTLDIACGSGEDCGNGVDDDGDGFTDCRDPECASVAACQERACRNGLDDDEDGATDCADTDCRGESVCLPEPNCANNVDEDQDGATDCADEDCADDAVCVPEADCTNQIDDDFDGRTDCADRDCDDAPECVEVDCGNLEDDDRDGATDCADSDCDGAPGCFETSCSNGLDDDRDGATDCVDADCDGSPACIEVLCDDRLDNERDGLVDCDDPDCFAVWPCSALCLPAAEIRCGDILRATTAGEAASFEDYGDCLATRALGGPETVFVLVPARNGTITLTLFDADFDAALLRVDEVCRPPAACVSGVDTAGPSGDEILRFYANAGQTYFVVVDGVDGGEGTFSLALGCSGQPESVCDNGADEDGDGRVDCADSDCLSIPPCAEVDCSNGVDDNENGRLDCADPSCVDDPACGEIDCTNSQDDDGDGRTDCADDECLLHPACGERCDNLVDDDGDGAADCADPDCGADPACAENCGNGLDDEGDGLTDCDDPECVIVAGCAETNCGDGADDDADGATDCGDLDCVGAAACREADCGDGADDDGDGFTDCVDRDCRGSALCFEVACANGQDDDADGLADCLDRDCAAAPACAGEVCRPVRTLGCGGARPVDLRDPGATDVFDVWPTCDLFGFDHAGPELAWDFPVPCTGLFTVTLSPSGASGGFFDLLLLDGEQGCTEGACRDVSYGAQDGASMTFEALAGERFSLVADALDGYAGPLSVGVECTCTPLVETVCDDGIDEDQDLALDCRDSDCAGSDACETVCHPRGAVAWGDVVGGRLGGGSSSDRLDAYPACDRAGFAYTGPEDTWSFTAPCTGPVTVTTVRTAGAGTADTLVLRADAQGACDADTCAAVGYMGAGGIGQVAFGAVTGAQYFLVVDSSAGSGVSYSLSIACGCLGETNCGDTVDNDGDGATDCLDTDCAGTPGCSASGECTATRTLTCDQTVDGDTTVGRVDRVDAWNCSELVEDGYEDIYRWVAPRTGLVSAVLDIQGNFDLDLVVLEDLGTGCSPTACLASSTRTGDEIAPFVAVAGRTYYIVVDGFLEAAGPYRLTVDCSPGCDVGGDVTCLAPVDGDLATAATSDALGAYNCDAAHDDYSGAEAVFHFRAPCTGAVDLRLRKLFPGPGAVDLVWLARSAVCDGACIAIEKMDDATGVATLTMNVTEGQEILLAVDGRDGALGAFRLEFDCEACLSPDPCYGSHATWCGATVSGTTADAEKTFGSYGCSSIGWPGGEVWRSFEPTASGPVTLDLATDGDLGVFVIEDSGEGCDAFRCVAGGELAPETSVTFDAVLGTRYFFVVDGRTTEGAPFALDVECP